MVWRLDHTYTLGLDRLITFAKKALSVSEAQKSDHRVYGAAIAGNSQGNTAQITTCMGSNGLIDSHRSLSFAGQQLALDKYSFFEYCIDFLCKVTVNSDGKIRNYQRPFVVICQVICEMLRRVEAGEIDQAECYISKKECQRYLFPDDAAQIDVYATGNAETVDRILRGRPHNEEIELNWWSNDTWSAMLSFTKLFREDQGRFYLNEGSDIVSLVNQIASGTFARPEDGIKLFDFYAQRDAGILQIIPSISNEENLLNKDVSSAYDSLFNVETGSHRDFRFIPSIVISKINDAMLRDRLFYYQLAKRNVSNESMLDSQNPFLQKEMDKDFQLIVYGAPGTGKSFGIESVVGAYEDTVRTTFHPDSDYATFVGCYKPTMESRTKYGFQDKPIEHDGKVVTEDVIVYSFVPQAFTKAYVRAWEKMIARVDDKVEPQFLVIEEINRGNCAQIFGDLFQLLDRDANGYSKFPIEADSDLGKHIAGKLVEGGDKIPQKIKEGKILQLPPNLYIWATMNTSDQSLFPMDSAFKRRWDWEYIPINDAGKGWKVVADGIEFSWWDFISAINKHILDTLKNEDKQLGYFFARPANESDDTISISKFVYKVLFYLYNDVFKDYDLPSGFERSSGGKFAFEDFFLPDGTPDEIAVKELLSGLLKSQD